MLYFAYGSNLDESQMRKRCPGATRRFSATLAGFELAFVGVSSRWGGAVATIIAATGGRPVQGLVYELPDDDLLALDRHEGVGRGLYRRQTVTVIDDDGNQHDAVSYVHRETRRRAPSQQYAEVLCGAYRMLGFDESALRLAIQESREPDPGR